MSYKKSRTSAFDSLKSTNNNNTTTSASNSNTNTNPPPTISVIVPIYNGESTASLMLANVKQVLDTAFQSYEIIVVDDGSYDNTLQILQKEQKLDPHVKVLSYTPNMGKGHAVRLGAVKSYGKIVMFIDGDSEISPKLITDFVKGLEDHDMVIGYRWHPLSNSSRPFSRNILSKGFNLVVRIGTGIKIKDTQAGLKAGNGVLLRRIFKIVTLKRYAFDVELLMIANLLNLNIKEVPITAHCKPERRLKISDIMKMVKDVAVISYRARIKRWYQTQIQLLLLSEPKEL